MHRARRPWLTKTTTNLRRYARRVDLAVRPVILSASALGSFVVAGFYAGPIPGWIVTGLALTVFEWRAQDGKSS